MNACVGMRMCACVGRESLLECFDAKIVYAQKKVPPPPTSLFDIGRQPSSINLSFVRLFIHFQSVLNYVLSRLR